VKTPQREVRLTIVAELLDTSESALRAYLQDNVSAADRKRWTLVEGLSVKKTARQEWRVRFRACWIEGDHLGIWLNLTTYAARTRCVEGSLRTELNRRCYSAGGCDEARIDGRRFRKFAGRWKVLVSVVVDLGSVGARGRRTSSTRAPPVTDERLPAAPSFLDTNEITRPMRRRCAWGQR
jgi:hypothetical protein